MYLTGEETEASKIGHLPSIAELVGSRSKVSRSNMLKGVSYKGWGGGTERAGHWGKVGRDTG